MDDALNLGSPSTRRRPMFIGTLFAGWSWPLLAYAGLCGLAFALPQAIEVFQGSKSGLPIGKFIGKFAKHEIAAVLIVVIGTVLGNLRWPWLPRWLCLAIAVVVGTACGVISVAWIEGRPITYALFQWRMAIGLWGLLAAAYYLVERAARHTEELHEAEQDRHRLETQMAEAQLAVMQAQVEPHFLFNTLAHIKRLYQVDPALGERMLEGFCNYLEGALPRIRGGRSSLGQELDLAQAYLAIQHIRMGRRLSVDIDVSEALRAADFPPMMGMSLVENAIKHGLGPLPEGGRLSIAATDSAGRLQFKVADTGVGLRSGAGSGIGLSNTRARLHAVFGRNATLVLVSNRPHGVIATIEIPLRFTPASPARHSGSGLPPNVAEEAARAAT